MCVTSVQDENLTYQLEDDDQTCASIGLGISANNILVKTRTNEVDAAYDRSQVPRYSFVNLKSGIVKSIEKLEVIPADIRMSADGRFIVWLYNNELYSYNIPENRMNALSLKICLTENKEDDEIRFLELFKFVDRDKIIVGDMFDVWQVDISGRVKPVCLTNGFGKKNQIMFRPKFDEFFPDQIDVLYAFNDKTKQNGFWKINPKSSGDPIMLTMADCLFNWDGLTSGQEDIKKAKLMDLYVVRRQTASCSPNLYLSSDLKIFKQTTFLKPEREYNWINSKLIKWRLSDGSVRNGILYKPQNFDSTKVYPIIFTYYQKRSTELNFFHQPFLSGSGLNIPYYVSNGYLVFVPDIPNEVAGGLINSLVTTITSVIDNFKAFPWINQKAIGLQGHSFGGYETNLLVTQSKLFAAASASAGIVSAVSSYGNIAYENQPMGNLFWENGQANFKTTPWDNKQIYIDHTVIFNANRIFTPLLLQHGSIDNICPFSQSVELFNVLRRLKKPVWLLEYQYQGHILSDQGSRLDFNIRQKQFFDHYLKHKPAPLWMVEGIPAKYKGIKSGLQLDSLNRTP